MGDRLYRVGEFLGAKSRPKTPIATGDDLPFKKLKGTGRDNLRIDADLLLWRFALSCFRPVSCVRVDHYHWLRVQASACSEVYSEPAIIRPVLKGSQHRTATKG